MIQFYAPDIMVSPFLGPEEAAHCVKVLRKRPGDMIYVTDGKGFRYECRILEADTRSVRLEVLSGVEVPRSWTCRITLAVAPTKNADRMAWLVEKATEIGVDEIVFIACRHSERKVVNDARLRKNAISAMNQSLKTRLPLISAMIPLVSLAAMEGEKFFGFCDANTPRAEFAKEYRKGSDVVIAIGPEGDFDPEEVDMLTRAGFRAITFGDERLRTETAALYGVTAVHVINNM